MVRLIGIDVDGTLVGSSGVVAPAVWSAAERARGAGIHLVLCSGRPAFGVALEYARRLDAAGWHAFQNGASILHLATGESRSAYLPGDCVRRLIEQARKSGAVLELYGDDRYVTESTSAWAEAHATLLGVPFAAAPFESLLDSTVRAQWLLSEGDAKLAMTITYAGVEVAQSTAPGMPGVRFIGLTREGINKGYAMRTIVAEYHIALQDVMYVGDSGNDLPALKIVGHPVAMANAEPAVHAAARCSVGHVDTGGVAQALEWAVARDERLTAGAS